MSVNSINSYNTQMSLTDFMFNNKSSSTESDTAASTLTTSTLSNAQRNNIYNSYGGNMYSGVGQAAMEQAVAELKAKTGGPVSFSMVKEYRDELESEFTLAMQVGLALMGVEECDDFQLRADSEGNIEIICDDEELKEKIATLLEETEGLADQFLFIQALGNIERTQSSMGTRAQMLATKAELSMEAVDIFMNSAFSQGFGYSSLLGSYDGDSENMQFFMGANLTV